MAGEQFGQGGGEDGLWVDMNEFDDRTLNEIKKRR